MPQPRDESPTEPFPAQALPAAPSAMKLSKLRHSTSTIESLPTSPASEAALAFRRSNPSAASLYASTLSPPGSRSMSPAGRGSPSRVLSGTVFDLGQQGRALPDSARDDPGEPLHLMLRAFVPHVAVYASPDTEALIRGKGFKQGLWELLRPFGENIQGKVTVRDSYGVTKPVEDFSIRFTRFGEQVEHPEPGLAPGFLNHNNNKKKSAGDRDTLADVEAIVERHLSYAEGAFVGLPQHKYGLPTRHSAENETTSPYYALYLRRLLSGLPIAPHETFAHPVACIIAISSQTDAPIETLRRLYVETSQGDRKLPVWVDGDYLRYYVLVHDEENDDITRSMGLFEQMKRHLGLHCHLLRVRSSQSAETDDDSIPLPRSDWMPAAEELAELRRSEDDENFEDPSLYIFESDATAIRTFVREMVTQSIIPTMERHASIWNDQIASRRRGITGRFMNLSRKWAGFGGGSRSSVIGASGGGGGRDGYDAAAGFYAADAPEAVMRKLADFAFMLRDWKLAYSTYDLLRADFSEAKAWKYHAAANEMAAASVLLMPQHLTSKSRAETVDQLVESALYSYHTRCNAAYGAMRSLVLAQELLRLRGGSNIDAAARWAGRLLESKILGRVGDALIKERLAICYASKPGVGSGGWGGRRRKSAAWSVLAAEAWFRQAKHIPARRCLHEAQSMYETLAHANGVSGFSAAGETMRSMEREITERLDMFRGGLSRYDGDGEEEEGEGEGGGGRGRGGLRMEGVVSPVDEESEALMDMRGRRTSIGGRGAVLNLETAPLRGDAVEDGNDKDEGFD